MSVSGEGRASVPPETSQDRPTAVLLHGLFGDGDNLKGLASRLDGERIVLRPSLPAHGDVPATTPLSLDAMADELAARIDEELPNGAPLHLIGHSLGGKLAMTLVLRQDRFAARVRSLCVLDIGPRRYAPHHVPLIDALLGLDTAALASRREADAALAADIPDAGVRAFLLKGLVRDGDAWRWRFDLPAIARDYADHLAGAVPSAAAVRLPGLFLTGGLSDYLQDGDRTAASAAFPDARIETIDGTGHWLHAERPDEVAAAVNTLLADTEAQPGSTRPTAAP